MSRFRLVIFDLDGTLVDTLGDIADALNFTLRSFALEEVPEERVPGLVGEGVARLLEKAMGSAASRVPEALPIFRERYQTHLCVRTRPYPGVPEMLAGIEALKAVATNKPGSMARPILSRLGLAGYFARVLGEGDVGRRKPDPEMVERLLGDLQVAARDALLVGDSVVDAETARVAGLTFCAVSWGYTPREVLAKERPACLFDSAGELLRFLAHG